MFQRLSTIVCGAAVLAATVSASPGASFNVSAERAAQLGCGPECFEILQVTNDEDLSAIGPDFDWDFYRVASNFSTAKAGDLLKMKPIDPTNLTVISGVSSYKIQYVSEDYDGKLVPVTGFIALPFSVPASGKFPLVAYAHGTFGMYAGCAVSNGPALFDYRSWSLLSEHGYAVVATDYAGLGTNATTHKYVAFPAHANDIFHSITAARQAFGAVLSTQWLSVGHSQGGGAVWKLAETIETIAARHGSNEDTNYIGTVAVAPATKVWDMMQLVMTKSVSDPNFHRYSASMLLPFMHLAIKRVYPAFGTSLLGEAMIQRLALADEAQLCASALLGLTIDLSFDDLTSFARGGPSKSDMEIGQAFQDATAPANGGVAHRPVLIVQGVNDTAIMAETTEGAWTSACATGTEAHLLLYPKQDHSGVLTAASADWLPWIHDRFRESSLARLTVAGNACGDAQQAPRCTKVTKMPFDVTNNRAELEVDLDAFSFN